MTNGGTAPEHAGSAHSTAVHRDEAGIEFSRIVAFSDGVFAIAITLLVLALDVPASEGDLWQQLLDQKGDFFAYAISFAVLGKLWLAHHRFFATVARFDNTLMGLNLLYLAFVALIPFTSELFGDYPDDSVAVIAYAVSIAAVSFSFVAQIYHCYHSDLMRPEVRDQRRRWAGPANMVVPIIFLLSIPIALVSPEAAPLTWLAIFVVGRSLADVLARLRQPKQ